ncbi:MAG: DUF6261 family protein [Paludibacteraceae bacterium]
MKIKTKINKVNNQTLGTLSLRVIDTVNNSGIEEAKTSKQFLILLETNNIYQQAVNPINVRLISAEVDRVFNERNQLFTEMITYIKGLTVSDDENVRAAAFKIMEEIGKFGLNFSRIRKADKTLRYIRIIESLQLPEYQEALELTKLTEKLNTINRVQREYERLYMNRGNKVASKVWASHVRKDMELALKNHLDEVLFLTNQYETEPWKVLALNLKKRFDEVTVTQPARQEILPVAEEEMNANTGS